MSFALEYRRKMQSEANRRASHKKKSSNGADFVVAAPRTNADTRANRRRVLAAVSLAGIILSIFNSGAMVNYAGGLGYSAVSMRVITLTESWHDLMQERQLTRVVEEIRGAMSVARRSRWQDIASGLAITPTHPLLTGSEPGPVRNRPIDKPVPAETEPVREPVQPDRPVMRAAVKPESDR